MTVQVTVEYDGKVQYKKIPTAQRFVVDEFGLLTLYADHQKFPGTVVAIYGRGQWLAAHTLNDEPSDA